MLHVSFPWRRERRAFRSVLRWTVGDIVARVVAVTEVSGPG